MSLQTLPATATSGELCAVIERDGGVIVSDFLGAERVARLKADLDAALAGKQCGGDDFSGKRTQRLGGLFGISPVMLDIVTQPHVDALARRFVCVDRKVYIEGGPFSFQSQYQIGLTQAIAIGPGEGRQALHRDDGLWLWEHREGGQTEARLQIMVAVTDFTEENGATRVIAGSHKWGDGRLPSLEETVPAEMAAGSVLFWLGSTYHGGGLNRTTDQTRIGVTVGFDRANLRLEENHYLALTQDTVFGLPQAVQARLGFRACAPACGWVEVDGAVADPIDLMHRRAGHAAGLTNLAARDLPVGQQQV